MDDLARFCCQNADCPLYGQRDAGNLSVCDRYGKLKQFRLLFCKACKSRFSERRGTPLFHSCLPQEKAVSVLEHLVEGNGVRQTERLTGAHRDTVMRLARLAGGHARGTGGTTSPTTPSTGWSWPSSPAPARSRTPRK